MIPKNANWSVTGSYQVMGSSKIIGWIPQDSGYRILATDLR